MVRIHLPPLRDRTEDIPLLVDHFLKNHDFNKGSGGRLKVQALSREALELMQAYQWPGNVRELVNVIERAVSFTEGEVIEAAALPEQLQRRPAGQAQVAAPMMVVGDQPFKEAKERWVSSFEKDYLLKLLTRNQGNISHAAREAGIDRKYFRKLMKKHGITAQSAGGG